MRSSGGLAVISAATTRAPSLTLSVRLTICPKRATCDIGQNKNTNDNVFVFFVFFLNKETKDI